MNASEIFGVLGIVLAGAVLFTALFFAFSGLLAGVLFRHVICRPKEKKGAISGEPRHSGGLDRYDGMIQKGLSWAEHQPFRTVSVWSNDGLLLKARYLEVAGSQKAVLMMHGYLADTLYEFSCGMEYYHDHGYSVLLPAQRAHDESQGQYICFGVTERYDVLTWCRFLRTQLGANCKILLHGVSMGASTVLMASDLPLSQNNVVGIVSDCGFTSLEAIMRCVLHRDLKLYGFPILPFARFYGKYFARFDTAYSAKQALHGCRTPILFIHGSDDELVPLRMTLDNYDACASPKRLLVVRGAKHGCSYFADTPKYAAAVEDFSALCGIET